jgi:predicted nucleic acid-binding protein
VARIIVLDASTLWLAANAPGKPLADRCRAWLKALVAGGAEVFLPEIADYEVRREFLRRNATIGIRRLDSLKVTLDYREITTAAMLQAAEFWALLR